MRPTANQEFAVDKITDLKNLAHQKICISAIGHLNYIEYTLFSQHIGYKVRNLTSSFEACRSDYINLIITEGLYVYCSD